MVTAAEDWLPFGVLESSKSKTQHHQGVLQSGATVHETMPAEAVINSRVGPTEMATLEVLAAKPHGLSLSPETHQVEKNGL